MRDEILYINGQLIDLGDDVNIVLNYKSNLLTDLGKIVGNNSYTIKLPKTMRNLGIIGISDIPSVISSFPRVSHPCRYFRNGIEVIPDGRAVLLAVGDSIEIALTWGNLTPFLRMIEDDKKLDEFEGIDDYINWNITNNKSTYDGVSEIVNMDVNYCLVAGEDMAVIHPSVRTSYVFKLIGNHYGLSFDFPKDKKDFIDKLMIPLLTRKGGYANQSRSIGNVLYNRLTGDITIIKVGSEFDKFFERITTSDDDLIAFRVLVDGKVTIRPTFKSLEADKGVYYGTETVHDNLDYFSYYLEEDNALVEDMYIYTALLEIDLQAGDMFGVNIFRAIPMGVNDSLFMIDMNLTEIKIGDKFPIVENLPSISSVDFIKAIASISGTFIVPSSELDVVKFISFEKLSEKGDVVDWSDKLIAKSGSNTPMNVEYSLEGFARRNNMLWADDDSVNVSTANGVFVVDDSTLEYERDAVELPFAATDTRQGKAMIRLYDYPNPVDYYDKGEPELQSVEPRILLEKNVKGVSTGTFDGLQWSSLLSKHYKTYQNTVKKPVVITEKVLLDEISLRDLDVSVPVYLRQYGRYYAIVEVKAPSNGVCECKLLQLEE